MLLQEILAQRRCGFSIVLSSNHLQVWGAGVAEQSEEVGDGVWDELAEAAIWEAHLIDLRFGCVAVSGTKSDLIPSTPLPAPR